MMRRSFFRLVIAVSFATASLAQAARPSSARFAITPPERPRCIEQLPCTIELRTTQGRSPIHWRVMRGALPTGLGLDRNRGRISGTPTVPGSSTVTIEANDSLGATAQITITIVVASTLEIVWQTAPSLSGPNLTGALAVTNFSGNTVDLTVIIVAVNEINKAFTLGYQKLPLAPGATTPSIPFGTQIQLPPGRYRVRADAVGEVAPKNIIYRSALEAGPFLTP
jgi:hypothetical protein